jgi:general secretion pathway protein D
MRKPSSYSLIAVFLTVLVTLTGCELTKNQLKIDRATDMEFQDYRDALAPRSPDVSQAEQEESGVPPLASYVSPVPENLKPMPLVSISVNQTVPVRDVLFELAAQTEYDIELDPRIKGSIIFTARNKPFDVVVGRIAEIAGLRYNFKDDVLRVELDTPYHKTYKIDYVNLIRSSEGEIRNDVAVVSGEGADTGSKFSAENKSEANFWGELETSLAQILGTDAANRVMRTERDPAIKAVEQRAPVEPTMPAGDAGGETDSEQEQQAAPPDAVLKVESLPIDDDGPGNRNNRRTGGRDNEGKAGFSLNKQAGLVNVYATEQQHKEVTAFLDDLRNSVGAQVLIEAKVLEVNLTDEFATGIDWNSSLLSGELTGGLDVVSNTGIRPILEPAVNPSANFFLGYAGNDISASVQAMSRFGTIRALASPRLTVLNNQSAVLSVANNQVYFDIDIDVTTEDGVTSTEIDSDIKNVPEGVLINVMPSINTEKKQISMAIRPTITRIVEFISDPAVAFVVAQNNLGDIESQIPVVNVQEMDSIIKLNSGQAVVMGGLMQDRYQSEQNAVPVLGEVPLLGGLFRSQDDSISKTELVIFLKATIVEDNSIHPTDKDVYRTFSQDRRPFRF